MPKGRRRWHRVADSLLREEWNNDLLAALTRLMCFANDRWASDGLTPEQAAEIYISKTMLEVITGKRRRDVALTSGRRLANVLGTSSRLEGDVFVIYWPKFAEFQRYPGQTGPDLRANEGESEDAPAPAPEEERERPSPSVLVKGETEAPEALEENDIAVLQRFCRDHPDPAVRGHESRVPSLVSRCLLYYRGKGERRADWLSTCKLWIERERPVETAAQRRSRNNRDAAAEAVRIFEGTERARRTDASGNDWSDESPAEVAAAKAKAARMLPWKGRGPVRSAGNGGC